MKEIYLFMERIIYKLRVEDESSDQHIYMSACLILVKHSSYGFQEEDYLVCEVRDEVRLDVTDYLVKLLTMTYIISNSVES